MKIGFVILHYKVMDKTVKCIKSIMEKIDTDDYEVIVVDNASPDGSGEKLIKQYENNPKIHIILNKENLGFSGGNNVGFVYAKRELKCEFIVMTNNDTYLIQDDFYKTIIEEYDKSKFAVMGPKIITANNDTCLPDGKLINRKRQKQYLRNLKIKYLLNQVGLDIVVDKIRERKQNTPVKNEKNYLEERRENVVLHGCCLVFSPQYIAKFDGLEEKTFLYCEEEFLYIRLIRNNLLSVYNPKLLIYHDEAAATKQVNNNNREKNKFVYKNLIEANKILKKELKQLEIDDIEIQQ